MYKIIIVGKEKVGKTSLKARYLDKPINNNLQSTLGIDFSTKNVERHGQSFSFQIWDLAGQSSFKIIRGPYLVHISGIVLVYALNDSQSLQELHNWFDEIWRQTDRRDYPLVFAANKSDLGDYDDVKKGEFNSFLEELTVRYGIDTDNVQHFVTSALLDDNVDPLFDSIIDNVLLWSEAH